MTSDVNSNLTQAEAGDFKRLAGLMIPASSVYGVPGADDPMIFQDTLRSLGRDFQLVRNALAVLAKMSGGPFADLVDAKANDVAAAFLARPGPEVAALGRSILQCYYRDDRVMAALGLEPRPPFPKGHTLPPSNWALLDPVRGRTRMWRDVDGRGV